MRCLLFFLCSPWFVAVLVWIALAACLDAPAGQGPSVARLVVAWDLLACGEPHRIAIELADDIGEPLSASAPCNLGGLTVDVSHFGSYHGRLYAWAPGAPVRSVMPIELVIDQPITRWDVATPP